MLADTKTSRYATPEYEIQALSPALKVLEVEQSLLYAGCGQHCDMYDDQMALVVHQPGRLIIRKWQHQQEQPDQGFCRQFDFNLLTTQLISPLPDACHPVSWS